MSTFVFNGRLQTGKLVVLRTLKSVGARRDILKFRRFQTSLASILMGTSLYYVSKGLGRYVQEMAGFWQHSILFLLVGGSEKVQKCADVIPYPSHYNPRLVYFLPTFWSPKTFFQGAFFPKILALFMVSIHERFLIKNGLWWRAYGIWMVPNASPFICRRIYIKTIPVVLSKLTW